MIELDRNQCRYPIGDPLLPDFVFCEEQKQPESPYCKEHHEKCYRKTIKQSEAARAAAEKRNWVQRY